MNDAVVQRSLLKLGLRLSRTVGLVVQRSPGKVDASRSAADLIENRRAGVHPAYKGARHLGPPVTFSDSMARSP